MTDSAITFSSVSSRFLEIHEVAGLWKSSSTNRAYITAFELFKELFGDHPVTTYTPEDAMKFRVCLQEVPSGWKRSRKLRGLKFEDVRKFEPKLSGYAIRAKLLALNSLFEYARTKQFASLNIFEGIPLK